MRKAFLGGVLALNLVAAVPSRGEEPCCPCPQNQSETRPVAAKPKDPTFGLPVAGGPNADKAEPLEPNRDSKLNHHQKKGSKDYFYLKLKPGAEVTLGLKAFDKGIDLSGARPKETDKPYGRVELQGPEGEILASVFIDGEPRQLRRASHQVTQAGRYVVAVGSDSGDMHKDQTVFKVSLVPRVLNCPGADEGAIAIDAEVRVENCFGGGEEGDNEDLFRFHAEKKASYRLSVVLPEGISADLKVKATYRNRQKKTVTLAEVSGSGGRVTLEPLKVPRKGDYFLEVSLTKPSKEAVPYSLTVWHAK